MEISPLITATASLTLSLGLTALSLNTHKKTFTSLSWQSRAFDCPDILAVLTSADDGAIEPLKGVSALCLIPHFHNPGRGRENPISELFDRLTRLCKSGDCS